MKQKYPHSKDMKDTARATLKGHRGPYLRTLFCSIFKIHTTKYTKYKMSHTASLIQITGVNIAINNIDASSHGCL